MDRDNAARALLIHYLDAIIDRQDRALLIRLLEFGFPGISRMTDADLLAECRRLGLHPDADFRAPADDEGEWEAQSGGDENPIGLTRGTARAYDPESAGG